MKQMNKLMQKLFNQKYKIFKIDQIILQNKFSNSNN